MINILFKARIGRSYIADRVGLNVDNQRFISLHPNFNKENFIGYESFGEYLYLNSNLKSGAEFALSEYEPSIHQLELIEIALNKERFIKNHPEYPLKANSDMFNSNEYNLFLKVYAEVNISDEELKSITKDLVELYITGNCDNKAIIKNTQKDITAAYDAHLQKDESYKTKVHDYIKSEPQHLKVNFKI